MQTEITSSTRNAANPPESSSAIRAVVRQHYGQVAAQGNSCGCAPTCCQTVSRAATATTDNLEPSATSTAVELGYTPEDTQAVPSGANLGLGCGNPHAMAALAPGETVLDLGSGAGFDALLAARAVGPSGLVIGVDMTPAMIEKSRRNLAASGLTNVEFRLGEIERLPVPDASVDVILSNCVINLSPDKGEVFTEAFRVLKAGGRLAIADIVALQPMPVELRTNWAFRTGCVAGAATSEELRSQLEAAGFTQIRIVHQATGHAIVSKWFPGSQVEEFVTSARIEAVKP